MSMAIIDRLKDAFCARAGVNALGGLCFILTLFGCGSIIYPDINKDPAKNNIATFRRDAIDCAGAYPESGSGIHIKQRIGCMNLKGWH
ncbi:hypothetical protein CL55_00003050 [Polynucleobacter duraquae]|uniref:Uncharacterized protein n=2 Tax=Polynucleobacter duraquae TaxID=1835254 RepID=A0A0E3V0J3_9BURK|nr:hypothetical protein CL55_00003050 [Polynucleobacter duraquae]